MHPVKNIAEARDGIETAILLALHAKTKKRFERKVEGNKEFIDTGVFLPKKAEFPKSMLTFDGEDRDRLYSACMDDLVVDPIKAIGRGLEIACVHNGYLKWLKVMPMPRPRGIVALTNRPHSWLAFHYRKIGERGAETYIRQPVAIAGKQVLKLKALGWRGFDNETHQKEMETELALHLSMFEDAHRSGAMLATVEEATKLTFPLSEHGYKDFLRLRDGYRDTPTGRKNPILHFCSKHLRSRGAKVFEVQAHDRGAEEIVIGPMKLSVARSAGYLAYAPEQNGTET